MEKIKSIPETDLKQGFYLELCCCMCDHEKTYASQFKKDVLKQAADDGWKELNSDEYQLIGHHCGCDYRDDD